MTLCTSQFCGRRELCAITALDAKVEAQRVVLAGTGKWIVAQKTILVPWYVVGVAKPKAIADFCGLSEIAHFLTLSECKVDIVYRGSI
jgi:hypothetical protein